MINISTIDELTETFISDRRIVLYGAGFYLNMFLTELKEIDENYIKKIECILVHDTQGNPLSVKGIPVRKYRDYVLTSNHDVLLTLGKRYIISVCEMLKDLEGRIVEINFDMFVQKPYQDIYKSIEPFLNEFLKKQSEKTEFCGYDTKSCVRAWTCWWQGENCAPEIVKACWNSHRRYLPKETRLIIITKDNYKQYITLPDYILEKVEDGNITLTTLSDIIRVNLLYKFGGIWFDSTLLLTKALPIDIYYTIDFLIAICCNTFHEVQDNFMNVPYNNEMALELGKHLKDKFHQEEYKKLIGDSFVQKLSYKIEWESEAQKEESIYMHIVKSNL